MASMTASEMRDRLDHRFKLLVGSRRGLERHHTLRHAVAWSYDLLAETETSVLDRCSVFAGGFDLQSACAIAGSDDRDEYAILEVLDALVRKSLLLAVRSGGRTRYSMLETIRQFAEEQLVTRDEASEVRAAHARYFAGRETDIMSLWDSPRQREAYEWFGVELANLRSAFRWAADGDLDDAATIATYSALLGLCVENYEPTAWAEEMIEPARAVDHPLLAFLCSMATMCWIVGRIEEAVRYSDAGQTAMRTGRSEVPFGLEVYLGGPYLAIGQPDRSVEWCRAVRARTHDAHGHVTALLVISLTIAGRDDDAMAATDGLLDTAEATRNPYALSLALLAYGIAWRATDPDRAAEAMQRGLAIARDSGNHYNESHLADHLAHVEVNCGDALEALDHLTFAIRHINDSGNIGTLVSPLANLAVLLDRLRHYEPAATIAGFAFSPLTAAALPQFSSAIAHLQDALGDESYESLARKGETMTTAAIANYAYDQIDQARAELNAVSE
jgi:tetratricopeptide (TPR) repeat protein